MNPKFSKILIVMAFLAFAVSGKSQSDSASGQPQSACRTDETNYVAYHCTIRDQFSFTVPNHWSLTHSDERTLEFENKNSVFSYSLKRTASAPSQFVEDFVRGVGGTHESLRENESLSQGVPVTSISYPTEDDRMVYYEFRPMAGEVLIFRYSGSTIAPGEPRELENILEAGFSPSASFRQRMIDEAPVGEVERFRKNPAATFAVSRRLGVRVVLPHGWKTEEASGRLENKFLLRGDFEGLFFAHWSDLSKKGLLSDHLAKNFCEHYDKCKLLSRTPAGADFEGGKWPAGKAEFLEFKTKYEGYLLIVFDRDIIEIKDFSVGTNNMPGVSKIPEKYAKMLATLEYLK